jgi:hypothetical protein
MTTRTPFVHFAHFVVALALLSSAHAAPPDLRWDVETSTLIAPTIEIRRGETVTLTPRFRDHSQALQLTNSETVALHYRSPDMSNGLFYAITGAVHNATNGQARVTWTSDNCPPATNLQAEFVILSAGVTNLRAYLNIRLQNSIFGTATTSTNLSSWLAFDWAHITNLNPASGPWVTSTNALDIALRAIIAAGDLAGTNHTISSTNALDIALRAIIAAGDLAGTNHTISATNALDSALRAIIAAGDLAGTNHTISATNALDSALRAIIAAGSTITGTVAAASWSATAAQATSIVGIVTADITTNNASQINSGTLADARIASTIARDSEVAIATNAAIDDATQRIAAVGYLLPDSTATLATVSQVIVSTQTIAGASVAGAVDTATQLAQAFVTSVYFTYPVHVANDMSGYGIQSTVHLDETWLSNVHSQTMSGATFSGTTTLSNLVVTGAQTNLGSLTVLGGGNVVTNDSPIAVAATNAQTIATQHVARVDNPHSVTAAQVGALTNNQPAVSFSGTTTFTNLVVNGAQTNFGVVTLGSGNYLKWDPTGNSGLEYHGNQYCGISLWGGAYVCSVNNDLILSSHIGKEVVLRNQNAKVALRADGESYRVTVTNLIVSGVQTNYGSLTVATLDVNGSALIRTNLTVNQAFYFKTNTVVTAPAAGFGGMYVDAATNYWFWHPNAGGAGAGWTNKLW